MDKFDGAARNPPFCAVAETKPPNEKYFIKYFLP
jgi:hypothetical protein